MSIHEMEGRYQYEAPKRPVKVVKSDNNLKLSDQGKRSELRLLDELIQRNPERAREFLDRLRHSLQAA